jgi:hypothetical protein
MYARVTLNLSAPPQEAVPPTCARGWGDFDGRWLVDSHITPPTPAAPFTLTVSRSLVGRSARPSGGRGGNGGFYIQDAGGIGASAFGATSESLTGVYGSDATRGPWRITAHGTLSLISTTAAREAAPWCAPSARVVPPSPRAAGALWHAAGRVPLARGFNTTLTFLLSAPAQRCEDVRQVRTLCKKTSTHRQS